jgi:hypothetical protein
MSSGMRNNTYKKPSGKIVSVPSRIVNSKATKKSEATLGKAQDTGKGRGPLRGVARRSREGMAALTDAQIKAKYSSQDNAKSAGDRARARTAGKVVDSKLIPAKTVPVKTRNLGGIAGKGGTNVGGMYRPMGTGGGMNWQNK